MPFIYTHELLEPNLKIKNEIVVGYKTPYNNVDFECDGVDDHVQIQQALDLADSYFNTNGLTVVKLTAGLFTCSTMNIYSRTKLLGSGLNTVIKLKNNTNDYLFYSRHRVSSPTAIGGCYEHIIENIRFDLNEFNNPTRASAIKVEDCRNFTLKGCKFEFFNKNCVHVSGNINGTFTIQPRIEGCVFDKGNRSDGVAIFVSSGAFDGIITATDMGRSWKGLVISSGGKAKWTLIGNWSWGQESCGYQFFACEQTKVIGCTAEQNFGHGVLIQDSKDMIFNGLVSNDSSYTDTGNQFGYGVNYGSGNTYSNIVVDNSTGIQLNAQAVCSLSNQAKHNLALNNNSIVFDNGTYFDNAATSNTLVSAGSTFNRISYI